MIKIINVTLYTILLVAVLILLSPLIVISLLIQPFQDTGVFKFFKTLKTHYHTLWSDTPRLEEDTPVPKSKPPEKPKSKRKTYLETLPYLARKHTEEEIRNNGYTPDEDPRALHHKHPFNPSFILPHDEKLYDDLLFEWWWIGDAVYRKPGYTKSYWDRVGRRQIEELFLESYIIPGIGISIDNAEEHRWVLETMAIPFYEVEYNYYMLRDAHRDDNSISETKEFCVRYKILNKMFQAQTKSFDAARVVVMQHRARLTDSQAFNPIESLWNMYWTWQDAELYYNQRKFFAREAEKR